MNKKIDTQEHSENIPHNSYPLLESLQYPHSIPKISLSDKILLAEEVRRRIIEVTGNNGGHLASSLGTVELTIALLSSMNICTGKDRVLWDVGHQAYPWKILTGRYKEFSTLRTYGGISGFLNICESPYDFFGAGHASTSISAGIGMALAHKYQGIESTICSVIGDGALTGGLALEALNQIGYSGAKLIIILNDNKFSISGNVGSLSRFISRSLSKGAIKHIKEGIKKSLKTLASESNVIEYLRKGERSFKSFITPGMLFEAFQLNYIGPINGHDIESIEQHIEIAKQQERSVLLHVYTEKGRGFAPAQRDPIKFHGVGQFTMQEDEVIFTKYTQKQTYTQIFSSTLSTMARKNKAIIAITAAMPEGTGLSSFKKEFPERCIDVGICEPHAVTMAGALAKEGMLPFVAIYSTFLQRAYDQIIHDIALQNLHVVFCIDRAGFVGEDGATHHGIFDIAYLRIIPNMSIICPADEEELVQALYLAQSYSSPIAIRYPKGSIIECTMHDSPQIMEKGVGRYIQKGEKIAIISLGTTLASVVEAGNKLCNNYGVIPTIFDARWVKPLPSEALCDIVKKHRIIVIVEEGIQAGGFASSVVELFLQRSCMPKYIYICGIDDIFVEHGTRSELLALVGLDTEGIYKKLCFSLKEAGEIE